MDVSNHSQDGFGSTENIGPKIVSNDRNVSNMESNVRFFSKTNTFHSIRLQVSLLFSFENTYNS